MSMKLYVGNLSFNTSHQDLNDMFAEIGVVNSVNVIEDRETGRSRGFAFVEMQSTEDGNNAAQRQRDRRPRAEGQRSQAQGEQLRRRGR